MTRWRGGLTKGTHPMWKISGYVKTIAAVTAAAAGVMVTVTGDDVLTAAEAVQIAIALLGAFGVYALPNAPAEATADIKLGPNGEILEWSAKAEDLTGVPAGEAIGRPYDQVAPRANVNLGSSRRLDGDQG